MSESSMPPMRPDWVGRRVVVRHSGESGRAALPRRRRRAGRNHANARGGPPQPTASDDDCPSTGSWPRRSSPPSTRDILALEEVCARGWRAIDTTWSRGWLLRADHGFTRRANSALPLRPIQGSLDEAIAAAHDWYGARGLPLLVSCPLPARQALDDALADRGFSAPVDVHVMVAALPAVPPPTEPVEIAPVPSADWLAGYHYRGEAEVPDYGRAILTRHDRVGFATVRRGRRGGRRSSRRGRWWLARRDRGRGRSPCPPHRGGNVAPRGASRLGHARARGVAQLSAGRDHE